MSLLRHVIGNLIILCHVYTGHPIDECRLTSTTVKMERRPVGDQADNCKSCSTSKCQLYVRIKQGYPADWLVFFAEMPNIVSSRENIENLTNVIFLHNLRALNPIT